ncbi:hypothetical protein BDQ12DRAFT_690919 [Crucibulum laeve]|uniref:T6SS Phospholipase effector Tle1-like catalytic domain-containing protein n=1 Tax=Crucibulum laeve TaxID=68775 RepID=A0A5C3LMP5_9AGAR|nr:hypothetical protein BDQ12DRAFT_690919 [Crucibulum laeve]
MSNGNGHYQEATGVSITDTVVERDEFTSSPNGKTHFGADMRKTPSPVSPADKPLPVHREETLDPSSSVATIPPDHRHRTLILCFDGTGDQFDADNSNIVQLVSLLKKNDRSKQMVYYQAGIGTYTSPKVATPLMSKMSKTLDVMVAWNLDAHVMNGYEFLMQNYTAGDRICIFGFSRGAYTARSLAGMLHKVGLLPADNFQQVPFAYKMYTSVDDIGWEQSNEFKKAFSVDVDIEFLGVWDTVDSVGLIPKRLPFTTSNTIVRTFRHALALDERRAKFKANLWNRPNAKEEKLGIHRQQNPTPNLPSNVAPPTHSSGFVPTFKDLGPTFRDLAATLSPTGNGDVNKRSSAGAEKPKKRSSTDKEPEDERKLSHMERIYSERAERPTDIEEVWFSGCHCDVGGGSVSNRTRHALARIPLRWMIRECFKANTGIMFDAEGLRGIGLDPSTLYPFVTPRPPPLPVGDNKIRPRPAQPIPVRLTSRLRKQKKGVLPELPPAPVVQFLGSEEHEELHDAMSPKYDQLSLKPMWWILEILPLNLRYQKGNNEWVSYIGRSNMGKPRFIPKQAKNGVKVHRSVKLRMEAEHERVKGKKYVPKAHLHVEPTWID